MKESTESNVYELVEEALEAAQKEAQTDQTKQQVVQHLEAAKNALDQTEQQAK